MFMLTTALAACAGPAASPVGPRALVGRILDDHGQLRSQGWRYLRGAISPDGQSVAFLGGDPQGRSRVGLAREGTPVAITPTDLDMTDFAWMPDSRSLLVDYTVRGEGGRRLDACDIIGLDGHVIRRIAIDKPLRTSGTASIAVSFNARMAIMAATPADAPDAPADLVQLNLDSGATSILLHTPPDDLATPVYLGDHELVVTGGLAVTATQGANGWAGVVDLTTRKIRRLTGPDQVVGVAAALPAGKEVVYEAAPGSTPFRARGIWRVPLTGGEPSLLVQAEAMSPSINPDGEWVLVTEVGTPVAGGALRLVPIHPPLRR